ncbi:MAG TPA: hypothetical protein DG754_14365 [Bacteroidales bacterium]|jgi:hypothetical protein|nr:hypothetical protein [Bacteroidales bacterium]
MKQLILLVLIFIGLNSFSQEKGEICLSLGTGKSDLIQFTDLDGAGSSTGQEFYSFSLSYIKPINSWIDLQTGLDLGYHKFKFTGTIVDPNIPLESKIEDAYLVSIPLAIRVNFLKYFYISTGVLLDLDFNQAQHTDNQTGIGAMAGLGAQYRFKQGIGVFVNPILSFHSLVPFSVANYHERIFESGIRLGISYRF